MSHSVPSGCFQGLGVPPETGQVLAPPTYLKVLLWGPEEILGDIYTRPGTREGVFLSLLTQSNGNIVRKDNANLKKLVAQTSFCLKYLHLFPNPTTYAPDSHTEIPCTEGFSFPKPTQGV